MSKAILIAGAQAALRRLGLPTKEEFAPGIPKTRKIEPLPTIKKPRDWTYIVQRHKAERAGEHLDLRLVDLKTQQAHSWAIPSATLPKPGNSVAAIRQPTHTADYALNFGKHRMQTIPEGYGKGTVRIEDSHPAEVFHSKPTDKGTLLRFNLYRTTHPEEYAIISAGKQNRLVNKTLSKERLSHLPIGEKPKLKEKHISEVDINDATQIMMPKLDGAHSLIDLQKADRIPRVFSYREAKRAPTGVIEHSHKLPELLTQRVPKDLKGTVLRAEIIGVDKKGKAIPAKDIGGMLNASVPNSRKQQKETKTKLRPVAFDVLQYKGKLVNHLPFPERYALLEDIGKKTKLHIAEMAETPLEKQKLLDRINSGTHPLTSEGVVLQDVKGTGRATKAKHVIDHDVYLREIFPTKNKDRTGSFSYSWSPRGKIVGRVGSGFSHALAKEMLENPEKYRGRVARIVAEQKYPSGALGKARFDSWHLEKGKNI